MEVITVFDFSQLDTSTRIVVQQEDKEFDRNIGEANGSFIYACKNLLRIQEALKYKRPGFVDYCNGKTGLSSSTAYRMLNVAKMFPESGNIPIASREAIYLLAEPTTDESTRHEIIEEAQAGKKITSQEVKTRKATGGIPKTTIEPLVADTAPVGYGKDKSLRYGRKDSVKVDSQMPTKVGGSHCLPLACDKATWRLIRRTFNDPVWAAQVLAAAASLSESKVAGLLGIERIVEW